MSWYGIEEEITNKGCPCCGSRSWHRVKDHSVVGAAKKLARGSLYYLTSGVIPQANEMAKEFHFVCNDCGFEHTWLGRQFFDGCIFNLWDYYKQSRG